MPSEFEQRARDIFDRVCEVRAAERAAFLDSECAGDAVLRAEVEALLKHDRPDDGFLEVPFLGPSFRLPEGATIHGELKEKLAAGSTLEEFTIVELLGEGGMGTVYLARQAQPQRDVALKIIKSALAHGSALERFELEAEILGQLRHEGIARIFSAGTAETSAGPRPYIAMELVEGRTLDEFARHEALPLGRKVELLIGICRAVQHAHQNHVIHRDLKPSNIKIDGEGKPKVLDFGVARATDLETRLTRSESTGKLIGTLAYMPPEQIRRDGHASEAAADIYSLGVIGYELLSGGLPFPLDSVGLPEVARAICEDEPRRLGALDPALREDLETIVSKAIAKDPKQRYASAAELANDLQRHLDNEPILARPPSRLYRLRKFARRNRRPVAIGAFAIAALIGGLIGTTYQMVRAQEQAVRAVALREFLFESFGVAGEFRRDGTELTVSQLFDAAVGRLPQRFDDQPADRAELADFFGSVYSRNGDYAAAEPLLVSAFDWRLSTLGPSHRATLRSQSNLAILRYRQLQLQEAYELFSETLGRSEKALGAEDRETLRTMTWLALTVQEQGDLARAEDLHVRALAARRRALGEADPETLNSVASLAKLRKEQLRHGEAEELYREALAGLRAVRGDTHTDVLAVLNNLASLMIDTGRYGEAEALQRESLAGHTSTLGEHHPDTLVARENLLSVLRIQGREAAPELQDTTRANETDSTEPVRNPLDIVRDEAVHEKTSPLGFSLLAAQAVALTQEGDYAKAEAVLRDVVAGFIARRGADHPNTLKVRSNLASVVFAQHRFEEARELYEAVVDDYETQGKSESMLGRYASAQLGETLRELGQLERAAALIGQAYASLREEAGPGNAITLAVALYQARLLEDQGEIEASGKLRREIAEEAARSLPAESTYIPIYAVSYGKFLLRQGHFEEAEPRLLSGWSALDESVGNEHFRTQEAIQLLVDLYAATGRDAREAEFQQRLIEQRDE